MHLSNGNLHASKRRDPELQGLRLSNYPSGIAWSATIRIPVKNNWRQSGAACHDKRVHFEPDDDTQEGVP